MANLRGPRFAGKESGDPSFPLKEETSMLVLTRKPGEEIVIFEKTLGSET